MEKIKKMWKELSVFGIVIVCVIALFIYRLVVTADVSTISAAKLADKITSKDSFVVYTGTDEDANTVTYQKTVETYLKKHRGEKIYYLNLNKVDDAEAFVKEYLDEEAADTANTHTYVFIDGELTKTKDGALGYYTLDKTMNEFKQSQ